MKFNISDFTLNEIIIVNKEYLQGNYFKLYVGNKDYVIFISRVGASLIDFEVYNIKHQINVNNPIEHEIIIYNQQYDVLDVDFFNPKSFYHAFYLENFLENYEFEFSELTDKTIHYLNIVHKSDRLIRLISSDILYKNLRNPTNVFEEKFSKFLYEICLKEINDNNSLQVKLMNMKKEREIKRDELDRHMEEFEKWKKLMSEKYGEISSNSYSSIDSSGEVFNIDKFLRN